MKINFEKCTQIDRMFLHDDVQSIIFALGVNPKGAFYSDKSMVRDFSRNDDTCLIKAAKKLRLSMAHTDKLIDVAISMAIKK